MGVGWKVSIGRHGNEIFQHQQYRQSQTHRIRQKNVAGQPAPEYNMSFEMEDEE